MPEYGSRFGKQIWSRKVASHPLRESIFAYGDRYVALQLDMCSALDMPAQSASE